jgi:hypothetical protein
LHRIHFLRRLQFDDIAVRGPLDVVDGKVERESLIAQFLAERLDDSLLRFGALFGCLLDRKLIDGGPQAPDDVPHKPALVQGIEKQFVRSAVPLVDLLLWLVGLPPGRLGLRFGRMVGLHSRRRWIRGGSGDARGIGNDVQ